MSSDTSFGQIVKERRAAMGLTQAELANRVGCAPITIRRIEGDNLRPSFQMAELLALALKIPEAEQLGFVRLARQKKAETPIPKPTPSPGEIGMADLTGRSVKGFQLGELIGSGGFGVVYRAMQPSVKRDVAIKIILPRFANQPDFIRRFETEAQLVARLEHPHIVPLYDYWREPDAAYLIMRLLRGGSLEEQINAGPISMANFQRIVPQICTALNIAHRHGVIHRDIKPANVMLDEDKNAYLTDFGIAKNLETSDQSQLTQGGAIVGSPAYISPEQILAEPIQAQSDIYCLGIMLFEILTGQQPFPGPTPVAYLQQHLNDPLPLLKDTLPDLPTAFDDAIQKATAKKPEDRYQNTLEMLADLEMGWQTAVSTSPPSTSKTTTPDLSTQEIAALENPYRGLRAFTEADATNFHGRNALVQELLGMMADDSDLSRFVAVVGPSGSGKSSVVKAGLIPALRRGGLPDSDNWFMVDLTPGSHPWEEVEAALLRIAVNPPDSLLSQLRDGPRGLQRAIRRILPDDGETELVMVIDQFEELFTLVQDEGVRMHFLEGLVTAVLDPKSRLRLIITLRADFTDRPLQYVDFGELMRQRTAFVLPLTPNELTDAITRPITQLGMEMEPALVTTIVREVGDQPGILPLLQYALTELFEERNGRTLTLTDYESTGGVLGALARRADEIYGNLDKPAQEATRQLFLRLITLGEGVEDTRRRVLMSELLSITGGENNNQPSTINNQQLTLDEYGRFRLLTFDHDPITRSATVEVAHEALLREWPRLREWLADSREDVRHQRLLAHAASQWEDADHDNSYLLRGSRLVEFEAWGETTTVSLTASEHDFLQNSIAARDQRHAEEEARRQRELETVQKLAEEQTKRAEEQTKSAQSLRQRALFLTGALIIAAILAVAAFSFARSSANNANLANTREAEAIANFDLAATNEAVALTEANQRATAQAVADEERDAAVRAEETAVFAEQIADEQREAAQAAEAVANEERLIAEEQARIAFSRELAAAAIANLDKDPERSVLLALHAVRETYTKEAEVVLHRVVPHLRVLQRMEGEAGLFIRELDYSPDGSRLVTAGDGPAVHVWDTSSGQELFQWDGHEEFIQNALYSNDSTFIATTGGSDSTAKVWDAATGGLLHTLNGHLDNPNLVQPDKPNWVSGLAISPDSKTIATSGSDGKVILWDAATGAELQRFTIPDEKVLSIPQVSFGPDGSWLAMWGWTRNFQENVIQIVNIASGAELALLKETPEDFIGGFAISPDGTMLLISDQGEEQAIRLWDIETGTEVARYPISDNGTIRFSPDGSLFVTGGLGGAVSIYETETGTEILELIGHQSLVADYHFSPDGTRLATASWDQTVRIWDLSPSHEVLTLQPFNNALFPQISQIAFNPDGSILAVGGWGGDISLWDPISGENLHALAGHEQFIGGLFFSPDGTRLASGSDDSTINVWDTASGELLLTMIGHEDWVNNLAYSPDGATIASVDYGGGQGFVWDAVTGDMIHRLPISSAAWGIAYSPDGALVAIGENVDTISIWDVTTGEVVQEIVNGAGADDVHFSPDGKTVIAAGYDGYVTIWDLETGTLVQSIKAHEGYVVGSAISPNGEIFATVSGDRTARLWDVNSGERLLILEDATQGLDDVEFSPDGTRLVTAGNDGFVRIYTLSLDELVAIAETRLSRSLTEAECQEYLHMDACPVN